MKIKKRYILSGAIVALMAYGLSGGCTSGTLPPKLSQEQQAILKATRFQATIGVEEHKYPVYSDNLIQALQETGLFRRVDSLSSFSDSPTLIASVERRIYGTATVPILTALSLGIIPTTVEEKHGHSFSLRSADAPDNRVEIEFSYRGPSTLGWYSGLLNLSSNRASGDVGTSRRFYDAFAWEIASMAATIDSLIARE